VILVDTTVWASYFNGADTPEVQYLDQVLAHERETVVTIPIIVTEVLQGFRTETGFDRAQELLCALPVLTPDLSIHVWAARLYRKLRRQGITIRGATDCIIAQTCIEHGIVLLTADGDFVHIARHTPLLLAVQD
jgi:hypothetical protein